MPGSTDNAGPISTLLAWQCMSAALSWTCDNWPGFPVRFWMSRPSCFAHWLLPDVLQNLLLLDLDLSSPWQSASGVSTLTLMLSLSAMMSLFSVTVKFDPAFGPSSKFAISYHNKLNNSNVVMQKFANDCPAVRTYCHPMLT